MTTIPKHAFYCNSFYQVLQAILYTEHKKETTAIILMLDAMTMGECAKFKNTELITFHPVNPTVACNGIAHLIAAPDRTPDEILAFQYMFNDDIMIHVFTPSMRFDYCNRDDLHLHDDGLRVEVLAVVKEGAEPTPITLPESHRVFRVIQKEEPGEVVRRFIHWDFLNTFATLPPTTLDTISTIFAPGQEGDKFDAYAGEIATVINELRPSKLRRAKKGVVGLFDKLALS